MSEIPVHFRPRRLSDWINPTGAKKVHSLIDKVYKRKNLEMAWEKVRANRGSGGVDGQSLEEFSAQLDQQLDRLQKELQEDVYQPRPVRQVQIPKAGKPGEYRMLGVPTIFDRVCQQALLNRLELFSSQYSMTPTSDIDEGDRRRTQCARCGKRYRADESGS
jgi:retron-type reverse transcriptase